MISGFINNHIDIIYQVILKLNTLTHYYDSSDKRIHKINQKYYNYTLKVEMEEVEMMANMTIFIVYHYKNGSILSSDAVRIE